MFRKKKYVLIFEAMGLAYSESLLDSKSSLKVRLIKFLINYFESFSFHKSDYVVVYTEILKDYTSNHFQIPLNKIYVIPHGVDLDLKVIPVNIPEVNFNYSSIIMYVGSLSELHGTPDLMNIILNTSNKKNDLLFIILGFGPLMSKFIKFVDDYNLKNVLFLGHVPSDHVLSYMSLADVLLIPHSKCLQTELDTPTKLFEYLKAAKPIVSFDYKAIREVVGDQASLVNPGDLDAFVDTIIDVLDRKKYYLNIARKAVSITEHFSWKKAAEKQFEMYQSIRSI